MHRARPIVAGLFVVLAGCGGDPAVRRAAQGDYAGAKASLASAHDVAPARMRALAIGVLRHEVARFDGDNGAARIGRLGACARAIGSDLTAIGAHRDAAGAAAAALLVDAKVVAPTAFADRSSDPNDAWRAVGTLGLGVDDGADALVARLADPSARVRQAAVDALDRGRSIGRDAQALYAILETTRRDPIESVRARAIAALADLAPYGADARTADAVDRLVELFPRVSASLQIAIVHALALGPLAETGGRGALETLQIKAVDHVAVEIAVARGRWGDAAAHQVLVELSRAPNLVVALHAVAALDAIEPTQQLRLAEIVRAAADVDPSLQLAAATHLASLPDNLVGPLHREALERVERLAERTDAVGLDANLLLASFGRASVRPRLAADLALPTGRRGTIVAALSRLGFASDAREALFSGDLDTRLETACAIVSASDP